MVNRVVLTPRCLILQLLLSRGIEPIDLNLLLFALLPNHSYRRRVLGISFLLSLSQKSFLCGLIDEGIDSLGILFECNRYTSPSL